MAFQPDLLANEPIIRLGVFFTVLIAIALWEILAARRPQRIRHLGHLGMTIGINPIGAIMDH